MSAATVMIVVMIGIYLRHVLGLRPNEYSEEQSVLAVILSTVTFLVLFGPKFLNI